METLADLTAAHRSGTLAERYPEVRRVLTGLADDELVRAGQLLSALDVERIGKDNPNAPQVRVSVTGNGTLSGLLAPLTAEFARHGLLLRPHFTDFGSYVPELSAPDSELWRASPDLVLCVLDHKAVLDEVPTPWHVTDVAKAIEAKVGLIRGLVDRFAAHGSGALVLNTLPLPQTVLAQLVDHRSRAQLGALWREANAALLRLVDAHPGLVVLDLDALLTEGILLTETRLSSYAKAHLSPALLARYARQVGHLARNVAGRSKKCLALDLDETVWGGILGECGPEGIEVADSYKGEAFRAFQKVAKQIGSQGVLLAAVSKNDIEPVRDTLRTHPGMTLREPDFVRVIANWRPKHDNLSDLAADLNIGVDSFVFVDDSPFECGLVRHELPEVAVVQVDTEPALHVERLLRDGWFDVVQVTDEDRARPATYRDELIRNDFLQSFDSLQDYLRELGVWVRLGPVEPGEAARAAQITLRTNQFNLTTERLQQADVSRLLADASATVLGIHSGDRFGANGLVGTVFLRRSGSTVEIENFLLSCRVFARGIEQACLAEVLRQAAATGAHRVVGRYRPTAKNGKVADFYTRNGFTQVSQDDTGTVFGHDLTGIPPTPEHIKLTTPAEGTAE
ncbi:HAD-IIIC family phosphatase [Streptomyces sp. NBC_00247]|uniref:HAD-IIIC family phosphatase n=1 Tax=Streptomyces sp. NBC_00247 TaxID=2975689 RepID=UPI002E2A171B|nr:HAD-IIIC family phosphatase [Streptomyces sp. NBC_00247]